MHNTSVHLPVDTRRESGNGGDGVGDGAPKIFSFAVMTCGMDRDERDFSKRPCVLRHNGLLIYAQ
jgi:hypothetical protein